MNKPENNEFLANLLATIMEFHEWQLDNSIPYNYDTIGLAEWLIFNKGIDITDTNTTKVIESEEYV